MAAFRLPLAHEALSIGQVDLGFECQFLLGHPSLLADFPNISPHYRAPILHLPAVVCLKLAVA
jgi:hypothetical protein